MLILNAEKKIKSVNTVKNGMILPLEVRRKAGFQKEKDNLDRDLRYFEGQLRELLSMNNDSSKQYLSVTARDSDVKKAFKQGCKKLAFNVKLAKKLTVNDIVKMLADYEESNKGISFSDKNELSNRIYKLLSLSKEDVIKIVRYHSLQVGGVFAKKVVLIKEDYINPENSVDNCERYKNELLTGKTIKPRGFRVSVYESKNYPDPVTSIEKKNDTCYILAGYVRAEDNFSILNVLLILLDYLKAGSPEIDTLPATV